MNYQKEIPKEVMFRILNIKIGLSSPELTPLDSSEYTLEELGKECKLGFVIV